MTGAAAIVLADLREPLPTGTVVLDASAGTGKTWTIAGLVVRYLGEGRSVDRLLIVTFGRAATSELRTRVRERLLEVATALAGTAPSEDPVVEVLRGVEGALPRLRTALASFDSATIATTHGFCEQVLRSLGVLSDLDPGTVLMDSLDELVTEVVTDRYLVTSGLGQVLPPFDHATALRLGRAAVGDPESVLLALDGPGPARRNFAAEVRAEVERRKRRLRLLCYDDQLGRVRAALADPVTGEVACRWLRNRFDVVLVDEFQDTDPVQWDILRRAFHGHTTLLVIGDPKQAVYAFRGADVRAYLAAGAAADQRQTLGTNWRSDPAVLDGVHALLRDAALGDPQIRVHDVVAGRGGTALGPAQPAPPVRLRWLWGTAKNPGVGPAREVVARDVSAQVVALLGEGLTVTPHDGSAPRPFTARDIAVLVRTGRQARLVREALAAVSVPSVLSGTASVFSTEAASDWLRLLEALEQPHRRGRVRRAALTSLIGLRAEQIVDAAGDGLVDDLAQDLRPWAVLLAERGASGLFAAICDARALPARVLARPDGERLLTDLRHVAEIVHRHGIEAQVGLAGLVTWLRERIADVGDQDRERARRLDTERPAVQVLTVHVSKGLEFPAVLVPFGWDATGGGPQEKIPRAHDADDTRTLFVGGKHDSGYQPAVAAAATEDAGEELRLLYVALTRAVSRLVVWWARTGRNTTGGALHRLLFCPDPGEVPESVPLPTSVETAQGAFTALGGTAVAVQRVDDAAAAPTPYTTDPVSRVELAPAVFTRTLDTAWRRTSFSALTRDVHEAPRVGSEPEVPTTDDEPDAAEDLERTEPTDDPLRSTSPMADLPAGAAFGTLVHGVLEDADLGTDPTGALTEAAVARLRRSGLGLDVDDLVAGLLPAVRTPLGPLAGGSTLAEIPIADQLRELDFELPLVGGDDPTGATVRLAEVADLLRTHLPSGDPVRPYAEILAGHGVASDRLRGYLAGSIDVVLRVGGRYVVADHKSNRLAAWDTPLTAWHYRRDALDEAMCANDYPLQALLYCVALHRFLRWRLPGYDPEQHLGGVLYLFLRGMCGPGSETGVWSWRPPAALVVTLSDLCAGGGS